MVKFISLLPSLVLAARDRRSIQIDSIEAAASEFLVNYAAVATNGCHCPSLGDSHPAYFGSPKNNRDRACKQWMAARDCLFLSGGVCENEASPSYTYDAIADASLSAGCNQANACDRALCEADTEFAGRINAFSSEPFEVIADNNSANECVRSNDRSDYDACCGSSLDTLAKYVTSDSRCVGDNVITEDCPAGQQKNEVTLVCEDCPANTFSSNSQCVPCNSNADILIVYDGSGSMKGGANDGTGRTKWEVQKAFVENFVSNFEIASDKVRIRGVQYNKNTNYDWYWYEGDTQAEVNAETSGITQYDKTSCNTCSQFQKIYDDFSGIFANTRSDSAKIILVFADGINGDNQGSKLQTGRQWAAANDAQIYFIRIGSGNLGGRDWSGYVLEEGNYFETGNQGWNALESLGGDIANKICSA